MDFKKDRTKKPPTLPVIVENIPELLRAKAQWLGWRWEWRDDAWTKPPINLRTGGNASVTDRKTWTTFEKAVKVLTNPNRGYALDGIGVALRASDGIVGIDWDKVFNPETGEVLWDAEKDVRILDTYAEWSPTHSGYRAFALAELPSSERRAGNVEIYNCGRYLTLTGHRLEGMPEAIEPRQEQVAAYHAHIFRDRIAKKEEKRGRGRPRADADPLSMSDAALLDVARRARNGGAFSALFDQGSVAANRGDHSAADLALCNMLAFYCQGDEGRIDRLFRLSGLYREKWERPDYRTWTIERAVTGRTEFYSPRPAPSSRPRAAASLSQDDPLAAPDPPGGEPSEPAPADGDQPEPGAEIGEYLLTDTANARRFVDQHKDAVRFDHSLQRWYLWDGRRWTPDELGRVQELAKITARSICEEAAECRDVDLQEKLFKHAKASLDMKRITAMIKLASTSEEIAVTQSCWDQDPWLMNAANGTIDLRVGMLRPHERGDLITKLSPVEFQEGAQAPLWAACMERWQPVPAIREFLQRLVGCSLSGVVKQSILVFMYGTGANGKSVFTEVVKTIVGSYGFKSNRQTFMLGQDKNSGAASPEIISLIGRRFVSVSEVQQGDRLNEALIKDLTGQDTMVARPLYRDEVNFKPCLKLWMYGNHRPRITGDDTGIWRRFLLIPFTVQIPAEERDDDLQEKLLAELPGILNWALAGCAAWQAEGLQPPAEVMAATEDYRREEDVIGNFISDCCYVSEVAWAGASELYAAYEKWCKDTGEYKKSQRFFGMSLHGRGYTQKRVAHGNRWYGLGVLTEMEREYLTANDRSTQRDDSSSRPKPKPEPPAAPELPFDPPPRRTEVIN